MLQIFAELYYCYQCGELKIVAPLIFYPNSFESYECSDHIFVYLIIILNIGYESITQSVTLNTFGYVYILICQLYVIQGPAF